jgi:hypothetical protein
MSTVTIESVYDAATGTEHTRVRVDKTVVFEAEPNEVWEERLEAVVGACGIKVVYDTVDM